MLALAEVPNLPGTPGWTVQAPCSKGRVCWYLDAVFLLSLQTGSLCFCGYFGRLHVGPPSGVWIIPDWPGAGAGVSCVLGTVGLAQWHVAVTHIFSLACVAQAGSWASRLLHLHSCWVGSFLGTLGAEQKQGL